MNQSQDRPADFKERRSERTPVSSTARLTKQNWYCIEVRMRDLSSTGFMVECDENVGIGSYVALEVPGIGQVRAQVRWMVGGRMGGMFLDPINLYRCEWVGTPAEAPLTAA